MKDDYNLRKELETPKGDGNMPKLPQGEFTKKKK